LKKIIYKYAISIILIIIYLISFSGCNETKRAGSSLSFASNDIKPPFSSFLEITGITENEKKAIKKLQNQGISLIYGMTPSTEAFKTDDNKVQGFAALVCEWLTGLFGIDFIPVIYNWGDLVAGMEAGEIDFTAVISPTEERSKTFYMTSPIVQRTLNYFSFKNNNSINETELLRPLRLIFLEGSITRDQIIASNSFKDFESAYVNDFDSAFMMLKEGKADAFIGENTSEFAFNAYEDLEGGEFYPIILSPVSITTRKAELEPIITVMEKALQNGGLRYLISLYGKGYSEYLSYKLFLQLTDEEKAYLKEKHDVSFAAEYDNYPICFYNTEEKQWQGIAYDVMNEIKELTGLSFKQINTETSQIDWTDMMHMLGSGEVSMLTELIKTEKRKDDFLWPENAITTDNYALLSKLEYHNISTSEILYVKIGLPKDTAYSEIFNSWFPNHPNTKEYVNLSQAFLAMDQGEVDMVMSSQYRFLLLTNFRGLPDYKANYVFDRIFNSTFGFNKNEELLCSIINKSLALIDTDSISGQWMRRTFDYRVKLTQTQIPWFIGATALVLVLFFLFFLFQRKHSESIKLEHQVQERTAELHKSRHDLEMLLEETKAAYHSKSVFLANMSHEIRTPMNSILGFSELALDDEIPNKTREYLGKILENTEGLLQIINDILDISKVESGKMELEKIPFDIHEILTNCRTLIVPKAVEKGIMLYFYVEPSIDRMLLGDTTRLRQVFINLLSNAVKFTNTGTIKVLAEIRSKTENALTMYFEVKDSGIGMTSEQIEKIFDPFIQAESGTMRKYGGTGLGLSITKNIIELMGGELSVESTPGIGSKFYFTITFETLIITEEERNRLKYSMDDIEKPAFNGEVLLCEDNAMNQQVICEHLARVGLKTVVAWNGRLGYDLVRRRMLSDEKQFNLIFMDMHMPVMDGLEASSKIMSLNQDIPIIAMTANIMSDDRMIYEKSGLRDCIGKPFTSQELWRCLLKYLTPINKEEEKEEEIIDFSLEEIKFQNNLKIYFYKNNQNKYNDIIKSLEENDIVYAHRLVHSLKSNAGQIGKTILQQAAADVERQLKDGKNKITPVQLTILQKELNTVLLKLEEEIKTLPEYNKDTQKDIPPENQSNIKITADSRISASDLEVLREIETLLRMGNPECLALTAQLRQMTGNDALKSKLIQQMDDFEFDSALDTLIKLININSAE